MRSTSTRCYRSSPTLSHEARPSSCTNFRSHLAAHIYIAAVPRHIADSSGLSVSRHPTCNSFAHAKFEFASRRGEILGCMNFQKTGSGVDEGQRTGRSPHNANRLTYDQLKCLLGIKRGMNDVADLIQQAQSLRRQSWFLQILAHKGFRLSIFGMSQNTRRKVKPKTRNTKLKCHRVRRIKMEPVAAKITLGSHAASQGGICPLMPKARLTC